MYINITPKKLSHSYAVEATFEANGIPYTDRFEKESHFKSKLKRTRDRLINAIILPKMLVIRPGNLGAYLAQI